MSRSSRARERGFTLAEIIVSVAILAVITTIVVTNQSKYSDSTLLSSTASSLGLSIREAQVYGVSVKEFTPGSNEFTVGYGVEFSVANVSTKAAYISFADRGARNNVYDSGFSCPTGGSSECIKKNDFEGGIQLSQICQIQADSSEDCSMNGADIVFVRPETDAHITFIDSVGSYLSTPTAKGVRITLVSPGGLTKSVIVYKTGQISVQ